jgi:hypothetical protein
MFLSTKLPVKYANTNKKNNISLFIEEYRHAIQFYIDYLWKECRVDQQCYDIPKYIDSWIKPDKYDISARALNCASTQACGIVKSRVRKLQKTQHVIIKHQQQNKDISKLQSKYDKLLHVLNKPNTSNVLPEINSICCEYVTNKTPEFDGLIILSSLGKKYGKIIIPIKKTSHFNKLSSMGLQKNSFLVSPTHINIRFDIQVEKKKIGRIEGSDQGMRTCITLSDGQVTGKCPHGHSLESICKSISKKKKGSKSFKKSQEHRKNYINWAIKQLDLTDIKEINLEKIKYLGKGRRVNRYLQSFTYKEIKTALTKTCNLAGVQIKETSNAYRSQRCSSCGFVHKSSRHGEMFKCRSCSFEMNADLNAAMNHRVKLVEIAGRFSHLPNKTTGFYWKSNGLFDVNGVEIIVSLVNKSIN